MEDVKPTIAFYTCSNGYGHFKRVIEVAGHLQQDFCIDIYCEKFQYDKFKPLLNVEHWKVMEKYFRNWYHN